MQKINIINGIPVIDVTLQYQGNIITIPNVVLDSGAERSVFDSDYILESYPEMFNHLMSDPSASLVEYQDFLNVGSTSVDFNVDFIQVGQFTVRKLLISLDDIKKVKGQGFNGLLGCDFLKGTKAVINTKTKVLEKKTLLSKLMKVKMIGNAPIVSLTLKNKGKSITLSKVILDTGTRSSFFAYDIIEKLDIDESQVTTQNLVGVNGVTTGYMCQLDIIQYEKTKIRNATVVALHEEDNFPNGVYALLGFDIIHQAAIKLQFH